MKKKLSALILVLLMIPAVLCAAAQAGYAESRMGSHYAVIGGDQRITIRSHADPGDRGGYSQALYAVELTGRETKAELDARAVQLLKSGAQPVWGGSRHCFHSGSFVADPEFTITASDYAPGSYLYVCYAFGCDGGDYNHDLIPYYERISTMSVRITREAEGLELRYVLTDKNGRQTASVENGGDAVVELDKGPYTLSLQPGVTYPTEKVLDVQSDFPKDQVIDAFTFDENSLKIAPALCGSGTITVTIGNYLDSTTRTERIYLTVPCAPQTVPTVIEPSTCTEDGLAVYLCQGHGINCRTQFNEVILPATGHELLHVDEYLVEPTATLPGVGIGTCKFCGAEDVEQGLPPIFRDVVPNAFYSQPLDYCQVEGWVTGVTADTFAPNNVCVRAQVVTFLWRAAGQPEPAAAENPFLDVKEEDFYYNAVLWAVENGITNGTDAAHFSPMGVCNRAQVVTFLWRAFEQPASEASTHPFTDVQSGSWYEKPVLWAVENSITTGMTPTAFSPNANCNRAQIVTFLYRAYTE